MKVLVLLVLVGAAAATPLFTGEVMERQFREKNIVMMCKELGLMETVKMVEMAKLTKTLATGGPFTLFAPTDDAWNALPADFINELKMNMTALTMLLEFHVHAGKFMAAMIKDEMMIPTLLKAPMIRFNTYDMNLITATGSPVAKPDQMASNGVIHVINRVMWPIPMGDVVDVVSTMSNFSTLLTAVQAAGLGETLKGDALTIFAPTNEAFAKIPKKDLDALLANKTALINVLTYHVVPKTWWSAALSDNQMLPTACTACPMKLAVHINDMGVMINDATVVMADAAVSNGVIHVIDTVLMPKMDTL
ncbi:protein sll1483-like [Amphiura filiformis]|uniref:protein sll1483-like n=1 Tax=Amphiura filiformis TaxID=82378 RepID=UPI003B21C2AE